MIYKTVELTWEARAGCFLERSMQCHHNSRKILSFLDGREHYLKKNHNVPNTPQIQNLLPIVYVTW